MNRTIPFLVVLLAACGGEKEQAAGPGAMPPMTVKVHVLTPEALDNALVATGNLMPNEEVDLVSELAGRVTSIGFEEGGNVSAGQVLLQINAKLDVLSRRKKGE